MGCFIKLIKDLHTQFESIKVTHLVWVKLSMIIMGDIIDKTLTAGCLLCTVGGFKNMKLKEH